MDSNHPASVSIEFMRPLVRYVDEQQAVLDVHLQIRPRVPTRALPPAPRVLELFIELDGEDGFHDEQTISAPVSDLHCAFRVEMVSPRRWWPAGMGEQPLYHLSVSLLMGNEVVHRLRRPLGLTSIRRAEHHDDPSVLLVNGQVFAASGFLPIDRIDERCVLPIGSETVVVVRDHYGPEVLYEAADRTGILIVQCVPIDPQAQPETELVAQIARLAVHPSLAGWGVGHQGRLSERVAQRLREFDPTHNVFLELPRDWAA